MWSAVSRRLSENIRRVHLILENQRAAMEDAVRRREVELRGS
jgi:hypothetical protein